MDAATYAAAPCVRGHGARPPEYRVLPNNNGEWAAKSPLAVSILVTKSGLVQAEITARASSRRGVAKRKQWAPHQP